MGKEKKDSVPVARIPGIENALNLFVYAFKIRF
jgi:hypothetical protein